MTDKIKILILNYNGIAYLPECLKSIQLINYDNFSTVIIDNNSTDGSLNYVKSNYPNIEIVKENSDNYLFSKLKNVIGIVSNKQLETNLPQFKREEIDKLAKFILNKVK